MASRRKFLEQGSIGFLAMLAGGAAVTHAAGMPPEGLIVADEEGETLRIRTGTAIVRIKIAKSHGAQTFCFLSESFIPGDAVPVHKHLNEDELVFIHRGTGIYILGEKQYPVSPGAVVLVPKGVWHGLQNTGRENIEMRFAYSPPGFEGFFREVGVPIDQPFLPKSKEERRAIARKWGMIHKP